MNFRLANYEDMSNIIFMFKSIVNNMNQNNICIWNEYYPFECFEEDINKRRLYLLEEDNDIVAACTLCDFHDAGSKMKWENTKAKAVYIDRLGVNVNYQGKGYGSLLIKNVMEESKRNDFEYVRLLVVDINKPAINLYEKNKFHKLDGIYEEKINENITFKEYAYEKKV